MHDAPVATPSTTQGPEPRDRLAPPPAVVVTLVHGTILFARWPALRRALTWLGRLWRRGNAGPAWYGEGSAFRERLETQLRHTLNGRPHILHLRWSGGNTVWDRLRAAGAERDFGKIRRRSGDASETLRNHLARVARDFPGAAQVLVGHSHGGNVCLYALRDQGTRNAVSALVCLSTPFVHARERHDSKALRDVLQVLAGAVYLAVFLASSMWVKARVPEPWDSVVFVGGFMLVIVAGAIYWALREDRSLAERAWAESIASSETEAPPTFVLLSDGDEALLALKVAEGLNVVARGLWRAAYELPARAFTIVGPRKRAGVMVYTLLSLVTLVWLLLNDAQSPLAGNPEAEWSPRFVLMLLMASLFVPAALLGALLLAVLLPALSALLLGYPALFLFRWLAFGWGGSIGLDVTAETCPLGTATVTRLSAPPGARGLRHAHIYSDERTPGLIAGFVRQALQTTVQRPEADERQAEVS